MKDGWYYLIHMDGNLWLDGVKKRIFPEAIQEAVIEALGELRNTEGYLEVRAGKFVFHLESDPLIVKE